VSTTARQRIESAFLILGVFQPGQSVPQANALDGFRRLNHMIRAWSLATQMAPCVTREVFDLEADKGGPSDPYTIGDGGDFDTAKPAWNALTGAGLILGGTDPATEIPLAIESDDAFQLTAIKELSNAQPTTVYYRPTFQDGLGTIILWPVPNTDANQLALYRLVQLTEFVSLSAAYWLPEGYEEAIDYNLAIRLAAPYGRPLTPDIVSMARESLGNVKRANAKLNDLAVDPMWTNGQQGGYIIQNGGYQQNR